MSDDKDGAPKADLRFDYFKDRISAGDLKIIN